MEIKSYQERLKTFWSIPGAKELRDARAEWLEYRRACNSAWENESTRWPRKPSSDVEALEKKYPAAVFALYVAYERDSANYEIAGYANRAYEALCNGEPWETVKAAYDADKKEFVDRHMWD